MTGCTHLLQQRIRTSPAGKRFLRRRMTSRLVADGVCRGVKFGLYVGLIFIDPEVKVNEMYYYDFLELLLSHVTQLLPAMHASGLMWRVDLPAR